MTIIRESVRTTILSLGLLTVICCGAYPLAVSAISATLFQAQAAGSLLTDKASIVVGSDLIGQNFSKPDYFWGRLSATAEAPYNAKASSGSNLGVNNPALVDAIQSRLSDLKVDGELLLPVPVDLVTASASGLDPDISPAAALYQAQRIAKARNISEDTVKAIIAFATTERTFGLFGEPRVNVLKANLKLDGKLD